MIKSLIFQLDKALEIMNKPGPKKVPIKERFQSHITFEDQTLGSDGISHIGFAVWKSRKDKDGYGTVQIDGRKHRANRVALEIVLGRKLKDGMCSLHTCDYPSCVDERHLYEGSYRKNSADRDNRGRANTARGEPQGCSKLTDEIVRECRIRWKRNPEINNCAELAREFSTVGNVGGCSFSNLENM